MRLLYLTRADAFDNRGGDTVQLERLAQELERRGHQVTVHAGIRFADVVGVDVVHIFNMQRIGETAAQLRRVRSHPTVISPILADTTSLDRQGRSLGRQVLARVTPEPLIEIGKQLRRVIAGAGEPESVVPLLTTVPSRLRQRVLSRCDAILPNSQWEGSWLETLMHPRDRVRVTVVPNGVDTGLLARGESADAFRERFNIPHDRFVLSVARFDERKNNLRLIQAANVNGIPCVLIGRAAPLHTAYFDQCVRESQRGAVRIVSEHLSQEELAGAYRAAWVHALPSWLETPGLSSLEAGLFGANVVVGECPAVREYFGAGAWYCSPGSVGSIARAMADAFQADRNRFALDAKVRVEYSWEHVGRLQERIYERVLAAPETAQ